MILKMRNRYNLGWVVYDGLKRVLFGGARQGRVRWNFVKGRWEMQSEHDAQFEVASPTEICSSANSERPAPSEEGADSPEWVDTGWAYATMPDGGEKLFVFDEGFLLNDDGRTIERIW